MHHPVQVWVIKTCSGLAFASAKLFLTLQMLCRLKQLDESNGHTHIGMAGDDQTDSFEGARTGHVHTAAKQDIVRHWLQGSLENVSPSGLLHDTLHSTACTKVGNAVCKPPPPVLLWAQYVYYACSALQLLVGRLQP